MQHAGKILLLILPFPSHYPKIIINCSNVRSAGVNAFIKKIQGADLLIWLILLGDSKSVKTKHQRSIFLNGAHWKQGDVHCQVLRHDLFYPIYDTLFAVATQLNLSLEMDRFTTIWLKARSLSESANELKRIGDELKSKYLSITYVFHSTRFSVFIENIPQTMKTRLQEEMLFVDLTNEEAEIFVRPTLSAGIVITTSDLMELVV
jgi:hypothetical protein